MQGTKLYYVTNVINEKYLNSKALSKEYRENREISPDLDSDFLCVSVSLGVGAWWRVTIRFNNRHWFF
jgi:hypothetical protein